MSTKITAQEARNTKIFVIENGEIVETTLFDHVAESAEETTSPRGVMHKVFVEGSQGVTYQHIDSKEIIDQYKYDELSDSDQCDYNYYGETTIRWELREWLANGKSRLLDSFESQEAADDEWFNRTYKFDFLPDDQRDTNYWYSREDAKMELKDRSK